MPDYMTSYSLKNIVLTSLLAINAFSVAQTASGIMVHPDIINQLSNHFGSPARKRLNQWQHLIKTSQPLPTREKLEVVNDFFNTLTFIPDQSHWGESDFWATPIEFLASGGGDCEDFAIAKYYTLRQLEVADEQLHITYVRALSLKQAHMVLSFFPKPDSPPLILDNINKRIVPAGQRQDLYPIYHFNGDGLWLSRQRGQGIKVGKSDGISHWLKLQKRWQATMESDT